MMVDLVPETDDGVFVLEAQDTDRGGGEKQAFGVCFFARVF